MDENPVLKPKLATPALIMSSAAVSFCLIYFVGALSANGQPPFILTLGAAVSLLLAVVVGAIWLTRARTGQFRREKALPVTCASRSSPLSGGRSLRTQAGR